MANVEETLTITLRKPITGPDGGKFDRLDLREPTIGEVEKSTGKTGVKANIFLVSMVAEVPEAVIAKLSARDFAKALAFVNSFFGAGPEATEN
jgi:hypothetical protein